MKQNHEMTSETLQSLLALPDFSEIYRQADKVRQRQKGRDVQIRAILEFSNHCRRQCRYCGLRGPNKKLERYRMTPEEMINAAREAAEAGYRTIVLQSGEDPWYTPALLGEIIERVKQETEMAVTVSCGEMTRKEYEILRNSGADRYLLKQETADESLYASLHPCGTLKARVDCLKTLKELGFETGSGFMVGLPGQTLKTIAEDLLLLKEISCDMAGIGPFISNPSTPLAGQPNGSVELCKRAVALARILLPDCNLPATTSLGVLDGREKEDVFSCGANVVMKKITPNRYKNLYEIYPASLSETNILEDRLALEEAIKRLDRIPV